MFGKPNIGHKIYIIVVEEISFHEKFSNTEKNKMFPYLARIFGFSAAKRKGGMW